VVVVGLGSANWNGVRNGARAVLTTLWTALRIVLLPGRDCGALVATGTGTEVLPGMVVWPPWRYCGETIC
jgi:hypothetical protein